jgi:hypothetical protein
MDKEINGMVISAKIMFDENLNHEQRNKIMCQIEDKFSEVISRRKNLVCLGGSGEWLYKK